MAKMKLSLDSIINFPGILETDSSEQFRKFCDWLRKSEGLRIVTPGVGIYEWFYNGLDKKWFVRNKDRLGWQCAEELQKFIGYGEIGYNSLIFGIPAFYVISRCISSLVK